MIFRTILSSTVTKREIEKERERERERRGSERERETFRISLDKNII